mmetsp:Transcript_59938/g.105377  ORF Transcript_59938/g.105377 Transcript_59938/m.105377 type:complete len:91 (-) Transcript_59938:22-294(-)
MRAKASEDHPPVGISRPSNQSNTSPSQSSCPLTAMHITQLLPDMCREVQVLQRKRAGHLRHLPAKHRQPCPPALLLGHHLRSFRDLHGST